MPIRSRAPVRISFGGGGTDVSPYCDEYGGCVLNATINRFAYGTLVPRHDSEIHIESADFLKTLKIEHINEIGVVKEDELALIKAVVKHMNTSGNGLNLFARCEVPPKSGLGSSASVFVALIGLFNHADEKMTKNEIAEMAYNLERNELGNTGGRQDQYAACHGGLNFMKFNGKHVDVERIKLKKDHLLELEKNLILIHVGNRGNSGGIIEEQQKGIREKKKDVIEALHEMKAAATEMRNALKTGDFERFGMLLDESWQNKKKTSGAITNAHIDGLYNLAKKNGAIGGKISGAGGGGHMMLFCEPDKEQKITDALEKVGVKPVSFTFEHDGLQTWEIMRSRY